MSFPLKRRMARVALLVAAAAPVVAMGAGTASAAGLPQLTDLGGLSSADTASHLTGGVDSTAKTLTPAAGQTLDTAGRTVTPLAGKTLGDATGQVGHLAGHGKAGHGTGLTGQLPTGSLGGLPI